MYGLGAAAADFDNDGHVDLLITALGGNKLFRNTGKGAFVDVTAKSGVGGAAAAFPASAAWVDYDRDGWLDLIVLHYVQWSIAQDKFCSLDGKNKSYCTPETYKGESPTLYRNRRDGTFQDVTKAAGLYDPTSKALGVALLDYNEDGWIDLFVANDTAPNRLYRNRRRQGSSWMKRSRRASRSTKRASRAPAWASMRRTTTAPAATASSSATSRTR